MLGKLQLQELSIFMLRKRCDKFHQQLQELLIFMLRKCCDSSYGC
jgi:hypothetical protein